MRIRDHFLFYPVMGAFAIGVLFVLTLTALLSCSRIPTYGNDPRAIRHLQSQKG